MIVSFTTRAKEKGEDTGKRKGKDSQDTDASKAEKPKCFSCGKFGHRKPECWKLAAEKAKSTSDGKPHNISELEATCTVQTQASASQVSSLTVAGRDPEEHICMWMLARPSAYIQGLMLLHSRGGVFECPPSCVGNNETLTSSGLKLRSASGAEGEHFDTASVRKRLGKRTRSSLPWLQSVAPLPHYLGLRMPAGHLRALEPDESCDYVSWRSKSRDVMGSIGYGSTMPRMQRRH